MGCKKGNEMRARWKKIEVSTQIDWERLWLDQGLAEEQIENKRARSIED